MEMRRLRSLSLRWRLGLGLLALVAVGILSLVGYWIYLDRVVSTRFAGRLWRVPATVYARPLELFAGRSLSTRQLVRELGRLGYAESPSVESPGTYGRDDDRIELATRAFRFWDGEQPSRAVDIRFGNGGILR
jgi:penicillin-binding protein 1B